MSAHCTVAECQQWLERTKISLASVDTELEASAWAIANESISQTYDTSTWVDATTTPKQVRSIVSMLVAAWEYGRALSDMYSSASGVTWGSKLEALAMQLLGGIASASVPIVGQDLLRDSTSRIKFWPNDTATALAEEDPTADNAAPRVMSMGKVF